MNEENLLTNVFMVNLVDQIWTHFKTEKKTQLSRWSVDCPNAEFELLFSYLSKEKPQENRAGLCFVCRRDISKNIRTIFNRYVAQYSRGRI
jgi:hypothetical protein